ncbi:amidase [Candidimonas sp. SYP-B2681]|uniref:amidase n=1 Tax=Candidimonas sp. SYP-B2681 TaxID=2497686 RepID=UPI000F88F209|nr:amidase [Candidimonas sp. SYP-B2681]RTZ48064.1 amidase [Candidimonas sp. SYP-B2681]
MLNLDPTRWSVHTISQAVSSRELSPGDVMETYLARIEQMDGKLHAFIEVYGEHARLAAQAAENAIRAGYYLGPLHGVPIAIKDLLEMEGRVVTAGSAVWAKRKSTCTATIVRRLVAAGAIILGKTHTVEFAFGGWGTNQHFGTPWNPWDMATARTPGGSSSGSAVAVAASLAPWAIGTDTGGSIRTPASWCGLTGLKTTAGRISNYGVLPLSTTLDTPGILAYNVADTALLYRALAGEDSLDERTLGLPQPHWPNSLGGGIKGRKLVLMPESERAIACKHTLAAYDSALQELERMGAEIHTLALPFPLAEVAQLNGIIMISEGYAQLGDLVQDDSQLLDADVRFRVMAGKDMPAKTYISALQRRREMIAQFDQAMQGYDALLLPSTPGTALRLEDVDQKMAPSHYSRFANFLDLPALSVPNGMDDQGLPTSLQIVGRRFDEIGVLRIGQAYQEATIWHERRPVMEMSALEN